MATTNEQWPRKDQQMFGFIQACLLFLPKMLAQVEFSHVSKISGCLTTAAAVAVARLCLTGKSKIPTGAYRQISSTAHMNSPVHKVPT